MNTKLQIWIEGAIIAAVAMALSYIPIETPNAAFDLSIGLIPLGVYAIRRGTVPAVMAGFVWGLLHILLGKAYILSIPQVIFEYPFAFAFAGLGGLFAKRIRAALTGTRITNKDSSLADRNGGGGGAVARTDDSGAEHTRKGGAVAWIAAASVTAVFARWFWHFWAGVLVWGEYAPEGMSPWLYSLIFNGASFLANAVMLVLLLTAIAKIAPRLYRAHL